MNNKNKCLNKKKDNSNILKKIKELESSIPSVFEKYKFGFITKEEFITFKKNINKKYELPDINQFKNLYVTPKENIDCLYKKATDRMYVDSRNYENVKYERDYWKKEWHILLEESSPERVRTYKEELNHILKKYEEVCKENKFLKEKLKKYNKKGKKYE